jgi:hypothetical protein
MMPQSTESLWETNLQEGQYERFVMIALGAFHVYSIDSLKSRTHDRIVIQAEMESRYLIVVALVFTDKLKY